MADIFDLFAQIKKAKAPAAPVAWVIAGLGNPGRQYEGTRHNMGFRCVDRLSELTGCRVDRLRFKALTGECVYAEQRVVLLKPQTYMNLSGESVREALDWYKLDASRLLVFCDDVNLAPGRVRIRKCGSDGGHNGLKNIIYHLHGDMFARIRVGVGLPEHEGYDLAEWVLGKCSGADIDDAIMRAADAAAVVLTDGCDAAAGRYNASLPPEK